MSIFQKVLSSAAAGITAVRMHWRGWQPNGWFYPEPGSDYLHGASVKYDDCKGPSFTKVPGWMISRFAETLRERPARLWDAVKTAEEWIAETHGINRRQRHAWFFKQNPDVPDERNFGPFLIRRIMDSAGRGVYLERYGIRFGSSAIYLHHILLNDNDRHLHSHPWNAAFLILRGGYIEERGTMVGLAPNTEIWSREFTHRAGSINRIDLRTYHRIQKLLGDTWTLGIIWGREGDWGFWVPGRGHVNWREYLRERSND